MANETAPVGVFDSGVGGLTLVRALRERVPGLDILYFADTAHVPYGERAAEEVRGFAVAIGAYLAALGAGQVLVGCNLSSAVAIEALKARLAIPVAGLIEPAAKAAVALSKRGRIGLLATTGTVKSGSYERELKALAPEVEVFSQAAPLLVHLVEQGELESERTRAVVREYLSPLLEAEIDTLIYGCTHYPWLDKVVRETTGGGIALVDPAEELAKVAAETLAEGATTPGEGTGSFKALVSGEGGSVKEFARRFLGLGIETRHVEFEAVIKEGSENAAT